MDIKAKISEIVEQLQANKPLLDSFMADPIATLEKKFNIDLPDEKIQPLVDGIKAKLSVDKVKGALGGLGNLLGKK
ncbi:MAG: hypothetical protein IJC67_01370 [Clostridia bacterium]|nr:hypothetical protein [Clostridia bacterium]